jgi:hypothetical protein
LDPAHRFTRSHSILLAALGALLVTLSAHAAQNQAPPPVPPDVILRDAAGRATIRAVRVTSPLEINRLFRL